MMRPKPHSDKAMPQHHFAPYSTVCDRCGISLLYVTDSDPGCISDFEVERRKAAAIAGRVFQKRNGK